MNPERVLTAANVDQILSTYVASAERVGDCISGLAGIRLLETLKRGTVGNGPYPKVALFEAANRIMTDLVILYGVRWLLHNKVFPFGAYTVEFGHENSNDHDISASGEGLTLIGEAFNVAQSFFGIKKSTSLKKLRRSQANADFRLIVCNESAVLGTYLPKPLEREYFLFVDVSGNACRLLPPRPNVSQ